MIFVPPCVQKQALQGKGRSRRPGIKDPEPSPGSSFSWWELPCCSISQHLIFSRFPPAFHSSGRSEQPEPSLHNSTLLPALTCVARQISEVQEKPTSLLRDARKSLWVAGKVLLSSLTVRCHSSSLPSADPCCQPTHGVFW